MISRRTVDLTKVRGARSTFPSGRKHVARLIARTTETRRQTASTGEAQKIFLYHFGARRRAHVARTSVWFPSPTSNPAPIVVTTEAFLGLTSQVQTLAVQTSPDFDTLSSDIVDSLREQVRQVHKRLDEVQKEVLKSRGEIGESSKGDSPFTPEI
ncbi:hypothetical protein B296_00034218 [Ensete ventricosum]|uniref:Uncharacterized protein n=1 Tax=Ensete ventricosum TaxID=4639 RepID=A0A426YQR4_ENSVE|nr:hypothetical protein B296_00034218 [Ensete ventricosum]